MSPQAGTILISGASSGLGAALARHYACSGTTLALGGRDAGRLEAVAAACRAAGAAVTTARIDVTDSDAMRRWVEGEDDRHPVGLVIANAGINSETGLPGDHPGVAAQVYRVNVLGALNTVEPLLPRLRRRRRGQVALVASLAGFRGFPRGPAYSGSKAALIVHGESWRLALAPYGVGVSVACPGYVRTAMTAKNAFNMPFLIEPDQAARSIAAGIARNRARIVFPWPLMIGGWMFRALPEPLSRLLIPRSQPAGH